jgi:N-glycosidase YbiA
LIIAIYFYRVNEKYGAFSNFAKYGFEVDGRFWLTSEHYFQAQKYANTIHEEKVQAAPTARDAARMGRDRQLPLRRDWEDVKVDVMRTTLYYKFASHPALVDLLLSTADEEIIEQTTNDYYWGCGSNGSGVNMLGKLLMELRAKFRKKAADQTPAKSSG